MFVRLLLTAVLATTLVSAQGGKKGGGGGGGTGGGGMGMPQRPSKVEQFVDKLKLTKEQKDATQPILLAALEQSAPLRDQISKGRVAIAGAMIEGKSGDEVKKLMDDFTSLNAQLTDIDAKAFGKIYALLKPNQAPKAAQAFELLVAILDPMVGGGGGRGGGRGRGRQ
jgi:Spy/CpxP family protein refolding chaperone